MGDPFEVSKASRDEKSVNAVLGGGGVAYLGQGAMRAGAIDGRNALNAYTRASKEYTKAEELMPRMRSIENLRQVAAHRDAANALGERAVKSYKTARRVHRGGKAAVVGGVGAVGAGIYGLSTEGKKKPR